MSEVPEPMPSAIRALMLAALMTAAPAYAESPDGKAVDVPSESPVADLLKENRWNIAGLLANGVFLAGNILHARRKRTKEVTTGSTLEHVQMVFHKVQDEKLWVLKREAIRIEHLLENPAFAAELGRVVKQHPKEHPHERLIELGRPLIRQVKRAIEESMQGDALVDLASPENRVKYERFWAALVLEPGEEGERFIVPRILIVPQSQTRELVLQKDRRGVVQKDPLMLAGAHPQYPDRIATLMEMGADIVRREGGGPKYCFPIDVPYIPSSSAASPASPESA